MQILVLGGNRFFGRTLASLLLAARHELTLLNRGSLDDALGPNPQRLRADRRDPSALRAALGATQGWDVVFDQICYEAADARAASEILAGRVGHYVFTSSQAVYALGAAIREEVFDPLNHTFTQDARTTDSYAEAKRQCESVFFRQSGFPVTAVRFPIVAGTDDYTGRLRWHLEHVGQEAPIYFPNLHARLSLIHSDDAAEVLRSLTEAGPMGALNAAAAEPLPLASLIHTVEMVAGRKAKLLKTPDESMHSPYGIEQDWFMDVAKLATAGIRPRSIDEWLRPTLEEMCSQP